MQTSHFTALFALTLGLAALSACGPEPTPVTPGQSVTTAAPPTTAAPATPATTGTPAAAATTATPATPPAAVPFKAMTDDQKREHMKAVVEPSMRKVFQGADARRYADFDCKTCHGERKQDPHVVLPVLKLSGDGFKQLSATKPAVLKFMSEQVTPAMVAAMGAQPYNPATRKGFGCGGCHKVN